MRIEPDEFPKTIKELREKEQMTVREAAKAMKAKNHQNWYCYEAKDREPTLSQAKRLLNALGYDLTITITKKSN